MSGSVRALLLDVDDTLLDTTNAIVRAAATGMARVWPGRSPDWYDAAARRFRLDPGGFFERYTTAAMTFAQMRAGRLGEVAEHGGIALSRNGIDDFEAAYEPAFREAQRVFPDAPGFARRCRDRGLLLAAVTNSSEQATQLKLAATGIDRWFAAVVTSDTLGFGKPDPRVYRHACALVEVDPADAVMVGDEPKADVLGPLAAGIGGAVWVRRSSKGEPTELPHNWSDVQVPDGVRTVPDLTSLPDTLDLSSGPGDG